MKGYRLSCCDCGLVHAMKFRVLIVTSRKRDKSIEGVRLLDSTVRVQFKAARHNRATATTRRYRKRQDK